MPPKDDLLALTQKLLDCIASGDWATYTTLCTDDMTCFEPEAMGVQVEGVPFHKFYFDLTRGGAQTQTTIHEPRVRMLGDEAAVVSFVRLVQQLDETGTCVTERFEETRVWQLVHGKWKHVHFHRS